RVRVQSAADPMADSDLVAALAETEQALVIVNSRKHALALYHAAVAAELAGAVHLSTRQIAVDRRRILAEVRARLADGAPCRLMAGSRVEAGVDLDFPRVWRAEAGLDQIVQAAGRCNRGGKRAREDSIVMVFRSAEHATPREIAAFAQDFGRIARRHR